MFSSEVISMVVFIVFVVAVLLIDLLFVGKDSAEVSLKEAGTWSIIWISLALLFSVLLLYFGHIVHGVDNMDHLREIAHKYAPELKLTGDTFDANLHIYRKYMTISYLTGYLIEETLSTDNLFVMLMILTAFNVRPSTYKTVLLWGILGAIVLRFAFIFAGSALIQRFEWVMLIFGAYLVYAGVSMFIKRHEEEKIDPQHHWLVKFTSRWFKVFPKYVGKNFFVKRNGVLHITPLLVVVFIIEFSDLIFAVDSIPAIFSVTRDPYVVFFSNIFAILGLRSLFFLLVHVVKLFYYLKTGISVLLAFIGFKLLFHTWLDEIGFQSIYSLYFILFVIVLSIGFSLIRKKREKTKLVVVE